MGRRHREMIQKRLITKVILFYNGMLAFKTALSKGQQESKTPVIINPDVHS